MAFEPSRILLTGASGFVGHHLTPLLSTTYPNAVLLTPEFDVRDSVAVDAAVSASRPDVCVHLAAVSAVTAAEQDEDLAWQVNLHGTLRLARAILRHSPDCLMLFASSADAYGGSFRVRGTVDETAPLAPMNVYGATKAAADLAIGSLSAYGLRSVRLRPFTHIGPGQSAQFAISAFARQMARIAAGLQEPLLRVGNLDTRRDFLDVRDVCAAYAACIAQRDRLPPDAVFNIASGQARRIGDILADLQALAGLALEVRTDPSRVRTTDLPMTCGDATRAREMLGWSPATPWSQTLRDVLNDWRDRVITESGGQ